MTKTTNKKNTNVNETTLCVTGGIISVKSFFSQQRPDQDSMNLNTGYGTLWNDGWLPYASDLAALYDQYRLLQVTVRIDWDYKSHPVLSGTAVAPLYFYSIPEFILTPCWRMVIVL